MSEFLAHRATVRDVHRGVARSRAVPPQAAPVRPLPLELAAFADLVDPALLEAAARRAEALGVGGDEVIRCHGVLSPDEIETALAEYLDLPIDPLRETPSPRHLAAACAGVLGRIGADNTTLVTVAPRGDGIRRLAATVASEPRLARQLRVASPERLAEYVRESCASELAREAVFGLYERRPDLSAMKNDSRQLRLFAALLTGGLLLGALSAPAQIMVVIEYFLSLSFIAWMLLRLLACLVPIRAERTADIPDRHLPIYTIIVPLYREAEVAPRLVAALRKIDYPREKLDIKLVLEKDDLETRTAVARLGLIAPFEVVAPPREGPRTKPKALAAALPFARGSLVVIYDAEDEPEPDQLRRAVAAFAAGPDRLACVQARLAVDNADDNWLTRQFAAEYAGQFAVFLPALARFRLPLPLGGTSNHFRTAALRHVGGWDPFNVTEDADLGMRLARFGYRTGVIQSDTWEEAPVRYRQWLRQRTRWFKGWMQTWLVHMRRPVRLRRELGLRGFMALQLLVGGTALSALVHPLFLAFVIDDARSGALFEPGATLEESLRKNLALATLLIGYYGSALFGLVGLARRDMLRSAWVLATIPLYWLLLSVAAWRALFHLIFVPHRWEKTEHGLARSSLRSQRRKPAPAVRPPRDYAANRRR